MKTQLRLAITMLVVVLFASAVPAVALNASTKVTVHYTRFAEDYTGWNVWLWPFGKDGAGYDFTGKDDFGVYGTFTVPNTGSSDSIGIIIRQSTSGSDWAAKDYAYDRFIRKFNADGSTEIWIVQGSAAINYTMPVLTPKFNAATIDGLRKITVQLNKTFTPVAGDNGFSISGPGNPMVTNVVTTTGASSGVNLTLTVSSDLALDGQYTITHATYGETIVTLGNVFNSQDFNTLFNYSGNDLGNTYTPTSTKFRLWAPTASAARLLVYHDADLTGIPEEHLMTSDVKGTWVATLDGDQNGTIYTYKVKIGDAWNEAVDPYVRAATINGTRGVVLDLSKTNPEKWTNDKPAFSGNNTDAIIYELHVRDLSMDDNSGISAAGKGKFLGLTEHGTKTPDGKSITGVDAIKALGVTHVQLLPIYDYKTIDESRNDKFNWGYDPLNYNVPEGSYSTKPATPTYRVTELKQTVQSLHDDGLRVVMDVVYNHVYDAGASNFEALVPGYYFRKNADGSFGNATGCGNEVASERPMVRKFIVESVSYWASQYHLDGFRFDLMGVMDVTTMQQVRAALDSIDPSIVVIGEGWNMGNLLPDAQKAYQGNASKLPRIGQFNDGIRDAIKGSVFNSGEIGYAQGATGREGDVKSGIVGNIAYGNGIGGSWGQIEPGQSVSYVEAHDNLTLWDKLSSSMPRSSTAEKTRVFKLSSSIALLAQGLPFVHAGQEFMRSKNGDSNSYQSPDSVNSLKWAARAKNIAVTNYFTGLITLRKQHPAFRMSTARTVTSSLRFLADPMSVIAYSINGTAVGDSWKQVVVAHNPNTKAVKITLPIKANWQLVVNGVKAGVKTLQVFKATKTVLVPAQATIVLHR
jgi:pullulanase